MLLWEKSVTEILVKKTRFFIIILARGVLRNLSWGDLHFFFLSTGELSTRGAWKLPEIHIFQWSGGFTRGTKNL